MAHPIYAELKPNHQITFRIIPGWLFWWGYLTPLQRTQPVYYISNRQGGVRSEEPWVLFLNMSNHDFILIWNKYWKLRPVRKVISSLLRDKPKEYRLKENEQKYTQWFTHILSSFAPFNNRLVGLVGTVFSHRSCHIKDFKNGTW